MIIFLYGEDSYRLTENRETVIRSYQAKHSSGFNFFRVEGNSDDAAEEIDAAVKSSSLFDEVKLIFVNNVFVNPKTAAEIYQCLVRHNVSSDPKVVALVTHQGNHIQAKPKELFDFLSHKKNLVREFSNLEGPKLLSWVKKKALDRGVRFDSRALSRFVAISGSDSWARINNLEKLANYSNGVISLDIVDNLIQTETEPNIFEFIDALGSGRKLQAFSLLAKELSYGRDPYYLLTMVTYQFRNMLLAKDLSVRKLNPTQISQKVGLHPFVVKKMMQAVQRLSLEEIKKLYEDTLRLEQRTKQGRLDLEDSLYQLVLQ